MIKCTKCKTTCYYKDRVWKKGDVCNFTMTDDDPMATKFEHTVPVKAKTTTTTTEEEATK